MSASKPPRLYPVRFVFGGGTSRIGYWREKEQGGERFLVDRGAIPLLAESKASRFAKEIPGVRLARAEPVEIDVRKTVRAICRPKEAREGAVLTSLGIVEDLYLTAVQLHPDAESAEARRWRAVIIDGRDAFFDDLSVAEVVERVGADALVGAVYGLWGIGLTSCSWPAKGDRPEPVD
jgi:hypothetical protein